MSEMEKQEITQLPSKTSAQLHNTDGMLGFNETDGGYQVTLENLAQYIAGDAKEFIPPTHGTAGQLLRSTGDGGSEWGDAASPEEIAEAVTDWLDENVPTGETLIVDESLTIEGAAADAKVTGEKITAAEGAITDLRKEMFSAPVNYAGITVDSSWTTGSGVDVQTGGNVSDSDYCRTGFIAIESTTYIHLDSETYDFNVWEYTSNNVGSAIFAPKGAYNDKDAFVTFDQNATYFRIGVRRKDLAHITSSDITALTSAIKTYATTDPTLSLAGAAADAKVVGDKIDSLNADFDDITCAVFGSFEAGHINIAKSIGATITLTRSTNSVGVSSAIIPCTQGDFINVHAETVSGYRLYGFIDSDNALLQVTGSSVLTRNETILAPANASKFIINCTTGVAFNGKRALEFFSGSYAPLTDANYALPNRCYRIDSTIQNAPASVSSGVLVTFRYRYDASSTNYTVQMFVDSSNKLYTRLKWGASGGAWSTWNPITTESDLEQLEEIKISTLAIFKNFGVIGDSFASGEIVVTSGSYVDYYDLSWGQILARMHGSTCLNLSQGGLSTRTWLTSSYGLALLNSSQAQQLYICSLGINDNSLGASYVGTMSDITDYSDPANYADTFYGNYGRIIEAVKDKAPNAKIILSTQPFAYDNFPALNTAIINLAEHYGVALVDTRDDPYMGSTAFTGQMQNGHPTATMYGGMALAYDRMFSKISNDYYNYFKDYVG